MEGYRWVKRSDKDYLIRDGKERIVTHLYKDEDKWICQYYDQDGLLFHTNYILDGDIDDILHYAIITILNEYDKTIELIQNRKECLLSLDWGGVGK